MKKLAIILFLSPIVSLATDVQRNSSDEIAAGLANDVGELTAVVSNDGSAFLRLGTSEHGTVYVSDPCAIHIAPRRRLSAGEYAISTGGTWRDDGGIILAEDVTEGKTMTNNVTVTATVPGVSLAAFDYDIDSQGSMRRATTASDTSISVTFYQDSGKMGGMGQNGHLSISNLEVWAWTSDSHGATWDTLADTMSLIDSVGTVSMSNLRQWVLRTYAGRTAEDWSLYPATNTVSLAGQTVRLNRAATLTAQFQGDSSTNAWHIMAYGTPVFSVSPGLSASAPGGAFTVTAIDIGTDTVTICVQADLGTPVTIQSSTDLQTWADVVGQTSSYPDTVTVDVNGSPVLSYVVTLPTPAAATCYFRATTTVDHESPAEVRIGDADLYIGGKKAVQETWTFGLTNGTTVTKTVLVLED